MNDDPRQYDGESLPSKEDVENEMLADAAETAAEPKEVICEAECLSCGEMVKIYEIGFTTCPHCKSAIAELTVNWEIIGDKEDD